MTINKIYICDRCRRESIFIGGVGGFTEGQRILALEMGERSFRTPILPKHDPVLCGDCCDSLQSVYELFINRVCKKWIENPNMKITRVSFNYEEEKP